MLNAKDILTLRKKLALYHVNCCFELSNVNGDENIDTKDLLLIRKKFAGFSTQLGIRKQTSDDNRARYIYVLDGFEFTVEFNQISYDYSSTGTKDNLVNIYPAIGVTVTAKNVSGETKTVNASGTDELNIDGNTEFSYDKYLNISLLSNYATSAKPAKADSPQWLEDNKQMPEIINDGFYNKYYKGWQNKCNLALPWCPEKQLAVGESISYSDTYFAYKESLDPIYGNHPSMISISFDIFSPISFCVPLDIYYTGMLPLSE